MSSHAITNIIQIQNKYFHVFSNNKAREGFSAAQSIKN